MSSTALLQENKPTPVPWRPLIVLCIINVNESVTGSLIWPFIPFMVADFIGQDNPKLGIYVGLLAGAFYISQFFSCFLWGWLSDRYGRRPTMIWGLLGTGGAMLIFGFSQSYGVALLGRFLAGFLNGNVGINKSYLADITDKSNQAYAFSILMMTWGVGFTVAPSVGGFFANPADNINGFDTQFWRTYPYLLPCLGSCITSLLGAVLGFLYLPETPTWIRMNQERRLAKMQQLEEEIEESSAALLRSASGRFLSSDPIPPSALEDIALTKKGQKAESGSTGREISAVLRDPIVRIAVMSYGFQALVIVIFDETLPLFFHATISEGGMGWTSVDIGIVGSVAGVLVIVLQLVFYPPLQRRMGHIKVLQLAYAIGLPYFFLFPLIQLAAETKRVTLLVGVCFYMIPKVWVHVVGFTATVLCVNNSALPHLRGAVNGFGQSMASAVRAIGPMLGGLVWSWSVTMNFDYHNYVPFTLLSVTCGMALYVACALPASLTKPRVPPETITEVSIVKEGN